LALALLAGACGSDSEGGSGGSAGSVATGGAAGSSGSGGSGGSAGSAGNAGSGGSAGTGGTPALSEALEAEGFSVQSGSFDLLEIGDCCSAGKNCSGNNPSSPYAALFLPPGPGQSVDNPNARADGTSPSVRLRADEAIVLAGSTPPPALYFGFTPYLFDRDSGILRKQIFASLSETLNNGVIAVDGTTPFGAPTLIVATADHGTEQRVLAAASAAGLPSTSFNTVVFDPAKGKFGLDDAADTFGVVFRVAEFADPVAGQSYLQNLDATVLRVTPSSPAAPDPLPSPSARAKDLTVTESALAGAVDQLEAAVIAAHPTFVANTLFVTEGTPDPDACIQNETFCAGDNRDTIYPSIVPRRFFEAPDDFYVVLGVNHAATGKAVYSSFSVYAIDHLVGVAAVTSTDYPGSAQDYLPAHPEAPKLYAWKIARQCGGEPHCLEIPDAGCPSGIVGDKFGTIAFRAYLEPATNTAPDPSTLVIDRVIRFSKTP
jgi:hypothetical protein